MLAQGARTLRTQHLLRRCGFLVVVGGVVGTGYILFQTNPSGDWQAFFPKCLFHSATGLHCPGCGCQRAIHYLLNGQIFLALQHNAMVIIALPWLTWEAVRASLMFLELPVPKFMTIRRRLSGNQAMSIAVAVMAFWLLRNVPFVPFEWLAPPVLESRH